ncbi:unnamed protein product [Gulo gulo]|uniref:Uncharacterized protein n=1 Tax=Gulo gulo TaxID=48420 RepID=A0A9X9PV89_GULGU|nr:unnamed protein product [Gulo gulo]
MQGVWCSLPERVFPSMLGEKERWLQKGPPSMQESGPSCLRLCQKPGIYCPPPPPTPASCGKGVEGKCIPNQKGIRATPAGVMRLVCRARENHLGRITPEPDPRGTSLHSGIFKMLKLVTQPRVSRPGQMCSIHLFKHGAH